MHLQNKSQLQFYSDYCYNPFSCQQKQRFWETSRSRRRGRRAATDHNTESVTTADLESEYEATQALTDRMERLFIRKRSQTGYEAISGDNIHTV